MLSQHQAWIAVNESRLVVLDDRALTHGKFRICVTFLSTHRMLGEKAGSIEEARPWRAFQGTPWTLVSS